MSSYRSYGGDGDSGDQRTSADRSRRVSHEGAIYRSAWEDLAPYVAEMCCTFILTITFLCNYSAGSDPIWSITSNAFMIMCLVYAFAHVSGGTLNPSICISLFLSGRFSFKTMVKKSLAQFAGATIAALINFGFADMASEMGPKEGFNWAQVTVVEILYTGMICFVYLNCASSLRNNPLGDQNGFLGLAVGSCFIAGGYAAKDITHAVMNSAVSVGLGLSDVLHGDRSTASLGFWYVLLDFLGAFLGAGLYRIVRPQEFSNFQTDYVPTTTQKVAGEFIGTFYVVLTKALNRISVGTRMGPEAWAVAAALSAMVYSLRDISGGYFNPAVTVSVAASSRGVLWWRTAFIFCLGQLIASFFAAAVYSYLNHGTRIAITFNNQYSTAAIILAEGLFSFLTSYVVLTTSTVKATSVHMMRRRNIAGYAYGSCHTVGGFAIGNISGSVLNPAVAIAFSGLASLGSGFSSTCIQYVLYEIVGGLLGTAAFFVTHVHLYREELSGKPLEAALAEDTDPVDVQATGPASA